MRAHLSKNKLPSNVVFCSEYHQIRDSDINQEYAESKETDIFTDTGI